MASSSSGITIPALVDCALPDRDRNELGTSKEVFGSSGTYVSSQCKRSEVKIGAVCPTELRAICEKGLLLLTITIPKIEHILWPFLLKMIIPEDYIGAAATVCRCISELCRHRPSDSDNMRSECKACSDTPWRPFFWESGSFLRSLFMRSFLFSL